MHNQQKTEKPQKPHKHEPLLLLICFLTTSTIAYILTNHLALLHT
jgi:hypothetical protein